MVQVTGRMGGVLHGIQATDEATGASCRGGCRGAIAHHERKTYADEQAADDQAPSDDQAPADDQEQPQYAPPAADPADELEHLAQLHASGVLTDDEFTAAKAKILGT